MEQRILNSKARFELNGLKYQIECRVSKEAPNDIVVTFGREMSTITSQITISIKHNEKGKVDYVCDEQNYTSDDDILSYDNAKNIAIKFIDQRLQEQGFDINSYYNQDKYSESDEAGIEDDDLNGDYSVKSDVEKTNDEDIIIKKDVLNCKVNTRFKGVDYQIICMCDKESENDIYIYLRRNDKTKKAKLKMEIAENDGTVSLLSDIKDFISDDELITYNVLKKVAENLINSRLSKLGVNINQYYYSVSKKNTDDIEKSDINNEHKNDEGKETNIKKFIKFDKSIMPTNEWLTLIKKDLGVFIRYRLYLKESKAITTYFLQYELCSYNTANEVYVVKKSDTISFSAERMQSQKINFIVEGLFSQYRDILLKNNRVKYDVPFLPYVKWPIGSGESIDVMPTIGLVSEKELDFIELESGIKLYETKRFAFVNFVLNFVECDAKKIFINGINSNDIVFDEYFMLNRADKKLFDYESETSAHRNSKDSVYGGILDSFSLSKEVNLYHYAFTKINMKNVLLVYKLEKIKDKHFVIKYNYKYTNNKKNYDVGLIANKMFKKIDISLSYRDDRIYISVKNNVGLKEKDLDNIIRKHVCDKYFNVDSKYMIVVVDAMK